MDVAYRYQSASTLREGQLTLVTSGGVTEAGPALHPCFSRGFLTDPGPAAQALLVTAAVARASYALARPVNIDPVVTSNTDRLRFESFSGCCGVHARTDILPAGLGNEPAASGTTNVDFNPDMRAALAGAVVTASPLLLRVGQDEVTVTTDTMHVTERKVKLPSRWLKGFGEVQALNSTMRQVAELDRVQAARFLAALPRTARRPLWAVQANQALTMAATPSRGAACIAGPQRLTELRPLLRFTRALRVYAPDADKNSLPLPSAWELDLGTVRFTLTLSPDVFRGFSGEGALLESLAAGAASADEDLIGVLLSWDPVVNAQSLAAWGRTKPSMAAQAQRAYLASTLELDFETCAGGPDFPYVCASIATTVPAWQVLMPSAGNGSFDHCWRVLVTDLTNQAQTHLANRADNHFGALVARRDYRTDEVVAAWPLLAPHHPELIAAHLLLPLSDGLEAGPSAATTAVNGLAQPGHEFGKMGHLALVAAMASGESDTRIAAASTWTRTAQDGRLTPGLAADAITQGVASNAFKLNRIAESLGYVATDPVAAASVAQAAMLATAALLPAKPTNLHLLLEQSARAAATGLAKTASTSAANSGSSANAIPPAIAALAGSSARTKLAEAARLLTQAPDPFREEPRNPTPPESPS